MKRTLGFVSIFALALSACQPAGDNDPIKIGYIGPLTGDASSYGTDTLNGVQLAVEEINAAGGVNGQIIELIAEDGRCTGADAASAAQKLIHVDKVVAIIGGQCSGETLAAAPIAEEAQVVLLSAVSSSPDVSEAGDFVFRNYPNDALKTSAVASYLNESELSAVAIISENTDFSIGWRDAFKGHMGEEALVFDEVVDPGTKDFRTLLTRLQDVESDVFVVNAQSPAVGSAMVQQLREQGFEGLAIGHDVIDTQDFLDLAGEASEGVKSINVQTMSDDSEFGQKFISKYGAAQAALVYAGHAYDALGVLAEAIAAVGTEGPAIRDYLYDLEEYNGVVGTFSFDKNGDVIGIPYALKEVQEGTFVTIADIEVN